MRPFAVRYPITDGIVVTLIRASLTAYAAGLKVQRKLPAGTTAEPLTTRMVTVRNDSGPEEDYQSRRRYGVNVWADDSVDAENMALDAMAWLRKSANGQPITRFYDFSGPYEIDDDPQVVVGGKILTHMYFTFQLAVRGGNA